MSTQKTKLSRSTKRKISESLAGRSLTKKHRMNISRGLRRSYTVKSLGLDLVAA